MKAIVLALSVLVSGSAFAGEFTSFGRIHFQSASTWVPANKVCHSNGLYYHTTKAAIAVDYCTNDAETNCETVLKPLVQPMNSTREVCTETRGREGNHCVATKTVSYNQSTKVTVATYRTQDDAVRGISPIRTATYTIPACKTAPIPAN